MPDFKLNTVFGNPNLPVRQRPGFYDNFNAADGPLDYTMDRKPWLRYESASTLSVWVRSGGKAKCNAGSTTNICVADALTADGTVNQKIGSVGAARLGGLVFRAVDVNNFWYVRWRFNSSDFRYNLYKVVGGVQTGIGTAATAVSTDGDVLSAVLGGSSITIKVGGDTILSHASTDLQTATKHGMYCFNSDFTPTYDQMEVIPVGGVSRL